MHSNWSLVTGGHGGWEYINEKKLNPIYHPGTPAQQKIIEGIRRGNKRPERREQSIRNLKGGMTGKTHRDETRSKMSQAQTGLQNSQFGSVWITHPSQGSKKCRRVELEHHVSLGWRPGRL